jgi:hypothetical protein
LIRTAIRIHEEWFQAEDQMSLLRTRHYNFRLRELLINTFALTLVAAVIAAAVAYLGYKLWLIGY